MMETNFSLRKPILYYSDFEKVNTLRNTGDYSDAISNLLKKYPISSIK